MIYRKGVSRKGFNRGSIEARISSAKSAKPANEGGPIGFIENPYSLSGGLRNIENFHGDNEYFSAGCNDVQRR